MHFRVVGCLLPGTLRSVVGRQVHQGRPVVICNAGLCRNVLGRTTTTSATFSPPCRATPILCARKPVNTCTSKLQYTVLRFLSRTTQKLPYEKDFEITKNVLVFSHNNSRFYKLLSIFGATQFLFWSYLSVFSYSTLRDVSTTGKGKDSENSPWWRVINLGKNKYKNGIALLCFSVGYIVLFITIMYPLRAVHSLWLLKGGKSVGITTYAPFGKKMSLVFPVENINCVQSRAQAQSQVPLKVKGKWFFYLLDQKGIFHNPELFDYTIGLRRRLK